MARTEARLLTDIWDDDDFLALTEREQRLFMFLISQPDLAHDGVIALRERRWSRKAAKLTADDLGQALDSLDAARFVVVDWDTEEVLVRSFVRRDRVYRQPNVMRAAVDHVPLVESKKILRVLLAEMDRIRAENPELSEQQSAALAEMEKVLLERVGPNNAPSPERPSRNPSENPSGNPSEHPSANATPATPGERGSSTAVSRYSPFPVPRAVPPPAGDAFAPAPAEPAAADDGRCLVAVGPEPRTAQAIVGWWIDQCPRRPPSKVVGQMSKEIKNLLDDGMDPLHIRQGIAEWVTRDVHPSVLPSLVNTAMNRRPRAAPTPPARPSTTDQRVSDALALAAELKAQELIS